MIKKSGIIVNCGHRQFSVEGKEEGRSAPQIAISFETS